MNSQVTLVDNLSTTTPKSQVRLLYKRRDQRHAVLLEAGSSKYFLTTSDDGVSGVKIYDAAQRKVAEVNHRAIFNDTFTLTNRWSAEGC